MTDKIYVQFSETDGDDFAHLPNLKIRKWRFEPFDGGEEYVRLATPAPMPTEGATTMREEEDVGKYEQILRDAVEPFLDWLDQREGGAYISEVRDGLIGIEDVIPDTLVVAGAHLRSSADEELTIGHFRRLRDAYEGKGPTAAPEAVHPDDIAVDQFAVVMKAKLAAKRAEGYRGWDDPSDCTIEHLSNLLRKHVDKGDPIDVGNFAMMLHQRGSRVVPEDDDITAYYTRQIEWSKNTFGPALRTKGVCNHIRKELTEIEAEPHDLSEWVDVIILAMDGFWRHGGTPDDLLPRLQAKQVKNFARTWPDWRGMSEDRAIEHDRSADAALNAEGK